MVARDGSQEPTVEKEVITGFATIATLAIGVKAWVEKDGEPRKAEILSKTTRKGEPVFYVHYQDFNKRLDEWVAASRIDITREVEFPVPEKPTPPKKEQSYPNLKNQKKDKKLPRDSIASTPDPTAGPSTPSASTSRPLKRNRVTFEAEHASPQSFAATPAPDDDGIDLVETPAGNIISALQTDPTIGNTGEVEGFSKEKEIEKLRTSGSMTQSAHEVARVRNLSKLQIGKYEVETWYFSPYPAELTECDVVYICEFCLSYFGEERRYQRHRMKCELFHPPGNEIYRDENVSFYEIDGRRQRTWCRNLCLLSKCFLDHKTLYYDVDPFLFYCMTSRDEYGCHLLGYFSKEKESAENYNVACILTLPQYQRLGYGRLLIAFSYELSKREGKLGSPEKPLSDLGLLGYRAFWQEVIVDLLVEVKENKGEISVDEIAARLAMTANDVVHTLQNLNMIKYFKGQHVICLTAGVIAQRDALLEKQKVKGKRTIDSSLLKWKPPVFLAAAKTWNW
ncbi:Histone acetyltransferase [Orbilia oligospora]|uniref:Histone acetyltransferase ESA1 n=1 Tax=Orbilia oligospora TaxID=2813651 RepID=A0A7C8KFF8_ORBOL|nr:Histone acetyltransferase [Orbilia oligospora]KAF3195205.1 Histone acetyltransferase [Orbilia oligospora]KAF3262025.1 Histone acetyltransferase [Orbilia oligospora]KAF3266729.1 Histone acetyltransferase [Orbilia oligospora]KAF3292213.1 Histone acetyltransferase [Orbilia oligospora]